MKKTYGGFLGAKIAYNKKVKRVKIAIMSIIAIFAIMTVATAHTTLSGKVFAGSTVLATAAAASVKAWHR